VGVKGPRYTRDVRGLRASSISIIALTTAIAACTSHSSRGREREPDPRYLLRPDEAPRSVPEGVEVWVDREGIDLKVGGERQRIFTFGPEPPPETTTGDPHVRELLRAESDALDDDDAVLIVHVEPSTPGKFLGHMLYMAETSGWRNFAYVVETEAGPRAVYATSVWRSDLEVFMEIKLHVEVSELGTTAQWHVGNTGAAQYWDTFAALGEAACARHPSRVEVRAALRELILEGCAGANGQRDVSFDRSLVFANELPSGVAIQTLAAVEQTCRASYPWLMHFTSKPLTEACEPGWAGEVHDFAWFRDEALARARAATPLTF
jgi:hypothetical protein